MPSSADAFSSNELFRYARVRPQRIIDLTLRAKKNESLRNLLEAPRNERSHDRAKQNSAAQMPENGSVAAPDLRFDYWKHLKQEGLSPDRLPMAADLRDRAAFDSDAIRNDPAYTADRDALLLHVARLRIAQRGAEPGPELKSASRILDFVETFPNLPRMRTRRPYATVVIERPKLKAVETRERKAEPVESAPARTGEELKKAADGLRLLWRARNRFLEARKREFNREQKRIIRAVPDLPPLPEIMLPDTRAADRVSIGKKTTKAGGKKTAKTASKPKSAPADLLTILSPSDIEMLKARAEAQSLAIKRRTETLTALRLSYEEDRASFTLEGMMTGSAKASTVAMYVPPGKSESDVTDAITSVAVVATKYDVPITRFCEAYEKSVESADAKGVTYDDSSAASDGCYSETPDLTFTDTVRILGEADLIRVDETFVKYSAGEISYVENVLAGEVRKRRVKSTRYFEQATETTREETSDTSKETSASTKQELKSQIESEVNSRLESDITASANASGGGTIGLIDVQGEGSVDASLGIGLDTSLSTSNESEFSQEILSKAVERTKKTVIERRLTRSYTLDETFNLHAIKNNGVDAQSFNGVYCFLNKHVAITESVYGRRLFLLANIQTPGRSLLCARMDRLKLAFDDVGVRPIFDITPQEITPASYMTLAARFKAQNVAPPPAPVITLGRTYKTDNTNTNAEGGDSFNGRKIAEIIVPYFEKYKRFLITENVKLPDGYEVMDVVVTVNHGANGISIPADLPLRAGGAMMFGAPALAAYGGYGPFLLPVWLWYVSFLASPLLHYNCDSSNVTVSIGTESDDSPYYFFDPDALIREIYQVLGTVTASLPSILQQIEAGIGPLLSQLAANAGQVPGDVASAVTGAVDKFIKALKKIFNAIIAADFVTAIDELKALGFSITQDQLQNLQDTMGSLFEPFRQFIQNAIDLMTSAVGSAVVDLFAYFMQLWESSQTLTFSGAQGIRGELPVSFNTIAIKPGITVNLSACLRRTDEALAKWQLETFANFYRSHLQLVADWESRSYLLGTGAARVTKPPVMLRSEEHLAIKERVLHALNNTPGAQGNTYTLDRMNFFEHALDWSNMSYRVFNYGPTLNEVKLEKRGAFLGTDERRRAFTSALWAQVMIPVAGNETMAGQVYNYFDTGTFDLEAGLENDALVAMYRDFVLGRETEPLEVSEPRFEVMPTEFIALMTDDLDDVLPKNPDYVI